MSRPHCLLEQPQNMSLSLSSLTCPICLDVLKQPVTVPCGHSYCLCCVLRYWDTALGEGQEGAPQCPKCRQRFAPQPPLAVNTVLAELAERVREQEEGEGERRGAGVCIRGNSTDTWDDLRGRHQRSTAETEHPRCEQKDRRTEVLTALRDTEQLLKRLLRLVEPELHPGSSTDPGEAHQENSPTACSSHHRGNRKCSKGFCTNILSAVSEFQDKLLPLVGQEWTPVQQPATELSPNNREELLKYSRRLSLDPNTAHCRVLLSQSHMRATLTRDSQGYGDLPERFTEYPQVLSKENLSGRCYLEVEWSGWGFFLALSYESVQRSGAESRFGESERSWALHCEKSGYELHHRGLCRDVPGPRCSRLGLLLDQAEGLLMFYSVSPRMELLHTTRARFTGPLCLGFRLYSVGDHVELCPLQ